MTLSKKSSSGRGVIQSGVRKVEATEDDHGQRIDNFLQRVTGGLPRSKLYKMIRKGELRINGKRVKAEYRVQSGDLVRIPPIYVDEKPAQASVSPRLSKLLLNAVIYLSLIHI